VLEWGVEVVSGYRGSGLSRKAYCQKMGIAVTTLDYYLRRENGREREQARVLPVVMEGAKGAKPLTLILRDGLRLEVAADFDEAALRRLLSVVG